MHVATRVGYSSESNRKKTVGITLPTELVKQARKHKLNISRITEQALESVIDHLEGYVDERRESQSKVWCSGRDLNPGLRLERPEYLVHANRV